MALRVFIIFLMVSFVCSSAVKADLPVFDNSVTVPTAVAPPGDSKWSFDGLLKAWEAGNHNKGGYNGFLGYWLVDPPLSMRGYMDEYRENGGGPVSSFFGIQPFKLQNALVKAFMGVMLLVFVGAAVLSGLNKVATGGGDFNYIHLGIKFMIGVLVIFHPDMIYAMGRIVQTSSLYALRAAVESVSLKEVLNKGSIAAGVPVNLTLEALNNRSQKLSVYLNKEDLNKGKKTIASYNAAAAQIGWPAVTPPTDPSELSDAIGSAWVNFNTVVGGNPEFQEKLKPLKTKFIEDMAKTHPNKQDALQEKFVSDVEGIVNTVGSKVYSIEGPGMLGKIVDGAKAAAGAVTGFAKRSYKLLETISGGGRWVASLIGSILIPAAAWLVLRVSAFVLEMTVVIIVFTYPLWFLDSTKKAFLGAWNGMVGTALLPAVLVVLLTVFEGVMATIYTVILGLSPVFLLTGKFVSANVAYLCMWLAGVIALCWKSPKITKAIMEGGSIVGQMMSAMMVSGLAGAMAGVGVSGTLAGLKSGQPGGMLDDGAGGGAGAGNQNALTSGSPAKQGKNSGSGGSGNGSGGGSDPPLIPQMVGSPLPSDTKGASNTEKNLEKRNGKEQAAAAKEIGSAVGSQIPVPGADMVAGALAEKAAKSPVVKAGMPKNLNAAVTGDREGGGTGASGKALPAVGGGGTGASGKDPLVPASGGATIGGERRFVKSSPLGTSGNIFKRIAGSGGQKVTGADGKSRLTSGGTGIAGWGQALKHNTATMASSASIPVWKAAATALKNTAGAAIISGGDPARLAQAAAAYKLRESLGKMATPVLPVQKANRIL